MSLLNTPPTPRAPSLEAVAIPAAPSRLKTRFNNKISTVPAMSITSAQPHSPVPDLYVSFDQFSPPLPPPSPPHTPAFFSSTDITPRMSSPLTPLLTPGLKPSNKLLRPSDVDILSDSEISTFDLDLGPDRRRSAAPSPSTSLCLSLRMDLLKDRLDVERAGPDSPVSDGMGSQETASQRGAVAEEEWHRRGQIEKKTQKGMDELSMDLLFCDAEDLVLEQVSWDTVVCAKDRR
ncbi:hypothetical protein BDW62DRAFT_177610 [Aspergillus aurantiobrunneus]